MTVVSDTSDEKKGRQAARERGLAVAGTLGVIDLAARRGLVSLMDAVKKLERTTFRAPSDSRHHRELVLTLGKVLSSRHALKHIQRTPDEQTHIA